MTNLALIVVDLERGRLGHGVSLLDEVGGKTVLQHTIDRVSRIDGLDGICLLHQPGQSLDGVFVAPPSAPAIKVRPIEHRPGDAWLAGVIASGRKWSLTAWRGGVGGMTVFDELLPAYPLHAAAQALSAQSLVVVRGDWCCLDPALASQQLELHRSAPEAMKLTFTQAPPGLTPLVIHASALAELAYNSATVANALCYNPKRPVIDPVGKDVNVPIPASVRDQYRRFIYDTPRAIDHLRAIADRLGDGFARADAVAITDASRGIESDEPWRQFERLPQQFTVELTPRRAVNGPIVPQHYLDLPRQAMSAQTIDALLDQLPAAGDTAVLFGHLGDALLHDDALAVIERATRSGFLGVGIETDLLVSKALIDRLSKLPLDVISVRINADTPAVYEQLMGVDGHGQVMDNLQTLFKQRNINRQQGEGFCGWVVPRLVKVAENLKDLETFFERWMTVSGWAVVDRAWTGRGLIPDLSPVPMEVPRPADRPIAVGRPKHRLTVLSDGTVCLCGQDWLGRLALGSVVEAPLLQLWREAGALADVAGRDNWVCPACTDWLAGQQQTATTGTLGPA